MSSNKFYIKAATQQQYYQGQLYGGAKSVRSIKEKQLYNKQNKREGQQKNMGQFEENIGILDLSEARKSVQSQIWDGGNMKKQMTDNQKQVNFSMFGSVKSGHSDSQSVKGQNQNVNKAQQSLNFDQFGDVKKSNQLKKADHFISSNLKISKFTPLESYHFTQKPQVQGDGKQLNIDDFNDLINSQIQQSQVSQLSKNKVEQQIHFSMFGSVKSDRQNRSIVEPSPVQPHDALKQNLQSQVFPYQTHRQVHEHHNPYLQIATNPIINHSKHQQQSQDEYNFDDFMSNPATSMSQSLATEKNRDPPSDEVAPFDQLKTKQNNEYFKVIVPNKLNSNQDSNFLPLQTNLNNPFEQMNSQGSRSDKAKQITPRPQLKIPITNLQPNLFSQESPILPKKPVDPFLNDDLNSPKPTVSNQELLLKVNPEIGKIPTKQTDLKIHKFVAETEKRLNELYNNIVVEDKHLKKVAQSSKDFAKLEQQTLNVFLKELVSLRHNIYQFSQLDSSASKNQSFINQQEIEPIIDGLASIREEQQQKVANLMRKLDELEGMIQVFINKIQQKKINIQNDDYYGVKSPFQMASAFSKASGGKVLVGKPNNSNQDIEQGELYKNFYIDNKFYSNPSYKKLFAPKDSIGHKSSFIQVNFEYIFDNSPNRKVLRIAVSAMNASDSNLNNLRMEVETKTSKLLAISPNSVFMLDLRPRQVVHQMLYISQYNPSEYFIPLRIEYQTETGLAKSMLIPIAIDISKFLIKDRPAMYSHSKLDYRAHQHFTLNHKSDLMFYNEGDMKIVRYGILNEMEKLEVREDLCQPGYNMQILSTALDNDRSRAKNLVEYLKFMYD